MAEQMAIQQGDSSDMYHYGVEGETDLTGYTCRYAVVSELDSDTTPILEKNATSTSGAYFEVSIVPSESEAITVGNYWFIVEIEDTASSFRREEHTVLKINPQGLKE